MSSVEQIGQNLIAGGAGINPSSRPLLVLMSSVEQIGQSLTAGELFCGGEFFEKLGKLCFELRAPQAGGPDYSILIDQKALRY